MKPMNEAAKDMAKTIQYMNEHGWCKGSYIRNGEVCMVGAILHGSGSIDRAILYKALTFSWLELFPKRFTGGLTSANDHPDTTRADISKVMDRALVLLIQEEVAA